MGCSWMLSIRALLEAQQISTTTPYSTEHTEHTMIPLHPCSGRQAKNDGGRRVVAWQECSEFMLLQANHVTAKTKRRPAGGIDLQLFKADHKLRQGCLHYCGSAESGEWKVADSLQVRRYYGTRVDLLHRLGRRRRRNVLNLVTHTTQYLYKPSNAIISWSQTRSSLGGGRDSHPIKS
jgi:hypothetical protein